MEELPEIIAPRLFGPKILQALEFAAIAHHGQVRRGLREVPYISHPAAVGLLLARAGFSEDVVIAGVLHDVLEDTEVTPTELEERFGKLVTDYVQGVSEDKTLEYVPRKLQYIVQIETALPEVKAISAADKIANMTNVIVMHEEGEDVLHTIFGSYAKEALRRAELEYAAVAKNFSHELVLEHKVVLERYRTVLLNFITHGG